ncbi:MFS-type transporter involved in bile tolerance (Atg22 family) [Nonomuraea polychroma]|uniref:MFS-type transporter involved in bile tolerance (Atg22 family) n=1 Tax=Nonomuraea polychroma TaxID=46176 RepID=A0A438MRS4_9ACTN|nr:MFS transporter [Nonomuraea polychroma]RVX47926.1 MFS-type transporter involved in bile tolerance (Atg22 family) [Nonomuraea polychroma]
MTTGVLRNPDFLRFLSSHVANELGANFSRVALPLVAVLVLHAGPAEVGVLASLQTAAYLLIGLPAGVWVDRMRRRRVMMVSDVARFVLLGSIPVAAELGVLSIEMMFVVALLAGTAQVFNDVADQTYLPKLVNNQQLSDGNGKLEAVRAGGILAGPGLGGALVQLVGASRTMAATALASLASVFFLSSIKAPDNAPSAAEHPPLLRGIGEGLSYLWNDRLLRMFVASSTIGNLCVSAVLGLSVLFLAEEVGLTPGVIGVLLMSGGLGGLIGGLSGGWLSRKFGTARMTWLAVTVGAPFSLLLPMTQADWRVACFAITSIMLSWSAALSNVGQSTYRQTVTPEHLLGRVNASVRFMTWGALPLGALLGGLIAQQIGVRQTLWLFLAGRVLSFVPLLFSPLPRLRDFDEVHARS